MPALALVSVLFYSAASAGLASDDSLMKKTAVRPVQQDIFCEQLCRNVIGVLNPTTKFNENYIFDRSIYYFKVDTLPQVRFWRSIMNLHEDTALLNFASTRGVVEKICIRDWNLKSEADKKNYLDSIRLTRNFDTTNRILLTT